MKQIVLLVSVMVTAIALVGCSSNTAPQAPAAPQAVDTTEHHHHHHHHDYKGEVSK